MNLLLVEDDLDIQAVIELSLALDPGISVTSYACGETALENVTDGEVTFDVALLDYRLPVMTGIDLHHRLLALSKANPILTVLITADVADEDVLSFKAAGIAGVISKPFDVLTLAKDVRALAQQRAQTPTAFAWLGKSFSRPLRAQPKIGSGLSAAAGAGLG